MRRIGAATLLFGLVVLVSLAWLFARPSLPGQALSSAEDLIEQGRYLVQAGGCVSCHLSADGGDALSGGLPIESPFGTFYASNITPDSETGIGGWQGDDFILALKHGRRPQGGFYYPAFPYRSYAGITDEDALAIGAYLMAQVPVRRQVQAHELPAWVARWQMAFWNRLADLTQPTLEMPADPQLARGAYLARYLGHCGECHTPRNTLGIALLGQEFAGGMMSDGFVEAIDVEALRGWSENDMDLFLLIGLTADGSFVGGAMEPVIDHNTSRLSDEDRAAMAAFLIRGQ